MKIGILGGIGPEATGKLYTMIIRKIQEKGIQNNTEYPQIIVNSIPAPELIFNTIEQDNLLMYKKGILELAANDVDFIAMACNTIHLFREELQTLTHIPIIDLREEVKQTLRKMNVKKVTVIATPSTINSGLYAFSFLEYSNPDATEINMLSKAIHQYNTGIQKKQQIKHVHAIARKHLAKSSELIILGCTEFALMFEESDLPTLNTLEVLANCIVNRWMAPGNNPN